VFVKQGRASVLRLLLVVLRLCGEGPPVPTVHAYTGPAVSHRSMNAYAATRKLSPACATLQDTEAHFL